MFLNFIFYFSLMCIIFSCSKEAEEKAIEGWGANLNGNLNFPKNLKNIKKISIGVRHTLVLLEDGTVFAWGENMHQETNVSSDLNDVIDIEATSSSSAALRSDGSFIMWGSIGLDDIPSEYTTDIVDIAVSGNYTAVLKRDGSVYAWSSNIDGYFMKVPFQDKEKICIEPGGRSTLLVLYKDKTAESFEVFDNQLEPE